MTWAKVDDRANEHPKQLKAGPKACWLWACGLMYCNRQAKKTGRIPKTVVHSGMLFPGLGAKDAQKLIEAELWSDDGDSYVVHEYERWNPEKKPQHEPGSLSEKRATAGRLGGKRSGEVRSNREANHEASLLHTHEANGGNHDEPIASSRTATPAYAHSRALDPPHPTPPHEDPTRRGRSKDLTGWSDNGSAELPPSWDPPFSRFVGVAFDEPTYRDALEQFRAHHVGAGTVATESAFFGKLSVWATKLWQERKSRAQAQEAQQSEADREREARHAREVNRWTD